MDVVSRHFSTIDSTNSWAKEHLHEFAKDKMTIVTADGQTGGRGQFNRKWVSPPGTNIYVTFCFFLDSYRADVVNIPQLLALSVAKSLQEFPIKIKWPNDLMLSGKKVGGILCETTTVDDKLGVVLGLGLNVNMEKALLDQIDQPAISLTGEREVILKNLTEHFIGNLEAFLKEGFTPFQNELEALIQKI